MLPGVLLRLWWRGRRVPGYRRHWRERFGFVEAAGPGTLWIHAVSVGEVRAAAPLVAAVRRESMLHYAVPSSFACCMKSCVVGPSGTFSVRPYHLMSCSAQK